MSTTSQNFVWFDSDLTCKPLDSLAEIHTFIANPVPWRTLCKPLVPHSSNAVKNSEVDDKLKKFAAETPVDFCHFDPDSKYILQRHDESTLPKVLVCHDMANGYHDDSVIDGTTNLNAYTFYNWACVDIFCYFSHHLVTIPPLSWINVAHAHGVKVIGTFITEWTEGSAFWDRIFASETELQDLVSALVTIAKTLKFEGWLLNVENKITQPKKLLYFVRLLHKTLHQEVPNAELIWYDSVTIDGKLHWQNELNEMNRDFFEACDGIFTNYTWSEQHVVNSKMAAAARRIDVYVGVDVWGRNFYGGGMFNTQEALKVIHKHGCSVAIFAPAWTHEAMGADDDSNPNSIIMGSELERHKRFLLRDRALWNSLWPYLKTKIPCTLPFQTSFCRGLGKKRRMYGEVLFNSTWYNLRHMQYQPNSMMGGHGYILFNVGETNLSVQEIKSSIIKYRQSFMESVKRTENTEENPKETETEQEKNEIVLKDNGEEFKGDRQRKKEDNHEQSIAEERNQKCETEEQNKIDCDQMIEFENELNLQAKYSVRKVQAMAEGSIGSESNNVFKPMVPLKSEIHDRQNSGSLGSEEVSLQLHGEAEEEELAQHLEQAPNRQPLPRKNQKLLCYIPDEKECLECFFEDSFTGGTCLKVTPSDDGSEEHRYIRLFHTDFAVEDTLIVCMVTKVLPDFTEQWLNLWVHLDSAVGRVCLVAHRAPDLNSWAPHSCHQPLDNSSAEFKELQTYLVINQPGFYVSVENSYGWEVFYFQVRVGRARVTSLCLQTGTPEGAILLGHVGVCARA